MNSPSTAAPAATLKPAGVLTRQDLLGHLAAG